METTEVQLIIMAVIAEIVGLSILAFFLYKSIKEKEQDLEE